MPLTVCVVFFAHTRWVFLVPVHHVLVVQHHNVAFPVPFLENDIKKQIWTQSMPIPDRVGVMGGWPVRCLDHIQKTMLLPTFFKWRTNIGVFWTRSDVVCFLNLIGAISELVVSSVSSVCDQVWKILYWPTCNDLRVQTFLLVYYWIRNGFCNKMCGFQCLDNRSQFVLVGIWAVCWFENWDEEFC